MSLNPLRRRDRSASSTKGVYVELDELARLQFQAQGFDFLPRQPVHSVLSGRNASRLRGRGFDFEEIRRYLPGDDIRSIDWRVTARTGKPHLRVFTEERDRPVILVVDQRRSMFFGSRRALKSVVAAETAALAAWKTLAVADRLGAVVFDDSRIVEFRPRRSAAHVMQILKSVAEMNHALRAADGSSSEPGMLHRALGRAARLVPHDGLVIVISDHVGFNDLVQQQLIGLEEHNDALLVFVHDPLEAKVVDVGSIVVGVGSLRLNVNTSDDKLRREFSAEFEKRLERLEEFARRRFAPVIPVRTDEEVAPQIRRSLGHAPRGER